MPRTWTRRASCVCLIPFLRTTPRIARRASTSATSPSARDTLRLRRQAIVSTPILRRSKLSAEIVCAALASMACGVGERECRPEQHYRQYDPQHPIGHHTGEARAERDARHRAEKQEPEDLQVDIAHAEVAGAGAEGERDGMHDVGTNEAPRRQRVIERGQCNDADGAGSHRR